MRLIDADALKKEVDNFQNCYNGWSDTYDKAYIIEAIEEAPTIEPKRGEWIFVESKISDRKLKKCSVCGLGYVSLKPDNYCPNCGADMRGKDDE